MVLQIPLHQRDVNADLLKCRQGPQCVRVLTYSGWNPPPGNRKMHGDLLYLYVVTLEDKKYHITASTHGFFLNQSVDDCVIVMLFLHRISSVEIFRVA